MFDKWNIIIEKNESLENIAGIVYSAGSTIGCYISLLFNMWVYY